MWTSGARILAIACLAMLGVQAMQSVDGQALLQEARQALTGKHKDTKKAQKLLLAVVDGKAELSPEALVYAYVYLGYIEDRTGTRKRAIAWYEKALTVEGNFPGILAVAREGLQRPETWIRHLDSGEPQPAPRKAANSQMTDRPLAKNLSAQQRRENFEVLWRVLDTTYADFELKHIDWAEVGQRYKERLATVAGDNDFYPLMFQLVNELKDTHSWLQNNKTTTL